MGDTIEILQGTATVVEVAGPTGPQGPAGAAGATGATGPQGVAGTGLEVLTTQGDLLYQGAATGERLPIGTSGQVLKVSSSGIPEWAAAAATGVTSVAVSGSDGIEVDSGSPITSSGTIALGVNASSLRSHINVADGAEVNVQANWTEADSGSDAFILNKPTLGDSAVADIGTGAGEVAAGDHTHGNITNDGKVGSTAGLPLKTGTAGAVEAGAFGTSAGQFAEGNHTHAASAITSGTFDNARINFAAPAAIGSTTPAAGTFTTLAANSGTLTANASALDLAQTWNNAAVTFRGVNWSFVDTASSGTSEVFRIATGAAGASAIFNIRKDGNATFSNAINVGTVGGTVNIAGQGGQWRVAADGSFAWTSGNSNAYGSIDLYLRRDAANTLAQYNGTNPQTFNIYNTFTSSTNHERGFLRWSSNVFQVGTEKGSGGGTARALEFQTDGTTRLTISDIGNLTFQSAASFSWSGRTGLTATAAGSLRILGTDGSTFNFLYLGVNSSSYPALKRSSAILQVRLGDDSAYTTIDANHRLQGTAPATAGATGTAGDIRYDADYIYVCTATNTWKRAAIATW